MHLRTSHSKLVGYWITEIGGGIHDVVHIWEYGRKSSSKIAPLNLVRSESLTWKIKTK